MPVATLTGAAAGPAPVAIAAADLDGVRVDGVGPSGGALAVLTEAAAAGPAAAVSAAAGPAAAGDLVVSGRGFGHGIGLSQYGAKGRAEAGKSAQQITAAYYPGTAAGTASDSRAIDVWLTVDTDQVLQVVREPGLVLRGSIPASGVTRSAVTLPAKVSTPSGSVAPTRWRIQRAGSLWSLQAFAKSTWTTVSSTAIRATLAGSTRVTFTAPDGSLRNITGTQARQYRGKLSANLDEGTVRVVATTTFTHYLRSVVPSEMPTYWHAQALGAQSIAARTYASYERASTYRPWWYDTCDSTSCQVFKGEADYTTGGTLVATYVWAASSKAVSATSGMIRTYGGKPAFTQFSASNGGYSVAGSQPYLKAFPDTDDTYSWTATISRARLSSVYGIGTITKVTFTGDGKGAWKGRVTKVTLVGDDGATTVSGDTFRLTWGLQSTLFSPKLV